MEHSNGKYERAFIRRTLQVSNYIKLEIISTGSWSILGSCHETLPLSRLTDTR